MTVCYRPIGVARTPHARAEGMPIQPVGALGVAGCIEVFEPYRQGLKDLEGFSHIVLLYHLHEIRDARLLVKPYLGDALHGVFATRSPCRPNPIGLSVLRLTGHDGERVFVENVDMLDGTPVLDIKPYVPAFDAWEAPRIGWFEGVAENASSHRADARFHAED
ncbi:tRNA (adenine(37)-N6)-methyltransferase [Fundidesulfovibrio magnetotacticus]|uniref:tRNA (Adenine(37)-N6)-methyltransferase n=1 Tax=Fundidesulfovibrio magnetotacticus TaxID=2730080 RepID=A0A6V8M2M8_9BACT|nr:tRNA (N6-threonylcarbamoyladenosine(37)-N6)-methyltransferase TrmO [Fundidesulfovibrio magnetotacticus]GFK94695.1 tRNA (adenine(37)-N6)-methyltransferase [Fundidesulfovibrio magnetotacticus]